MTEEMTNELLSLTADIVSAHVANNNVPASEVSGLIAQVHGALAGLASPSKPEEAEQTPAVPIRSSVKNDHIVCLEDGKKLKMLKRYLRTNYNMTPDEYRTKWKLPRDYPMVAPAYAEQRRGLAKQIGLGRKRGDTVASTGGEGAPKRAAGRKAAAAPTETKVPARRGRKPKSATPATA